MPTELHSLKIALDGAGLTNVSEIIDLGGNTVQLRFTDAVTATEIADAKNVAIVHGWNPRRVRSYAEILAFVKGLTAAKQTAIAVAVNSFDTNNAQIKFAAAVLGLGSLSAADKVVIRQHLIADVIRENPSFAVGQGLDGAENL